MPVDYSSVVNKIYDAQTQNLLIENAVQLAIRSKLADAYDPAHPDDAFKLDGQKKKEISDSVDAALKDSLIKTGHVTSYDGLSNDLINTLMTGVFGLNGTTLYHSVLDGMDRVVPTIASGVANQVQQTYSRWTSQNALTPFVGITGTALDAEKNAFSQYAAAEGHKYKADKINTATDLAQELAKIAQNRFRNEFGQN